MKLVGIIFSSISLILSSYGLDKSPNFKGKLTDEFSNYFEEAKTSETVKISNYPTIQRANAYYIWAKSLVSLPKATVNTKLGMQIIK